MTVKITRPLRGSTNESVVVRRRFGPPVAIQPRDDRNRSTRIPLDEREPELEAGAPGAAPEAL
ncbi:MAG TPA: hypothetical protein VNR63_07485 [Gaiellaceae bacterium]|nr:hypothetical protein [Gaiellaceae bacterium]